MRPQIPDKLEEAIEEIYEEAGYATETELVRDAIRQHVNRLESGQFGVSKAFSTRGDMYSDGRVHLGENHHANYRSVNVDMVVDGGGVNGLVFGAIGSGKSFFSKLFIHRALSEYDDLRVVVVDPLEGFENYAKNVQSSQVVPVDATTPLGLFTSFTDVDYLEDSRYYAQAMHNIHRAGDRDVDVSKLMRTAEPLVEADPSDVSDAFVEPLQKPNVSMDGDDVLDGMAAVKPFVNGEYRRLREEPLFDITETRLTYLKAREGTMTAAFLAAYRQARAVDDPVIVLANEAHLPLQYEESALTSLLNDDVGDNVGMFFVSNDVNSIEPRTLRTVFKNSEHKFGFRTERLGEEQAFQLDIGAREREYFSSLLSGKNDIVHGAEMLYRGRDEWCPVIVKPSSEEMEIVEGSERTEY